MLARLVLLFSIVPLALAVGCGSTTTNTPRGGLLSGDVVERAEGFSQRPDWADPNQSLSTDGTSLTVTGYVSLPAEQRLDMGYRVADSYARAELLRFLTTRVVAVLEDRQTSTGEQSLRERIEETATAVVDDWIVAGHYWEKRREGDRVRLHVWSRLDVDRTSVADLLTRANEGAASSETPVLTSRLDARWGELVKSATLDAEALPAGVSGPSWAAGGDAETDGEFTFVCQATAEDETKAKALAQARCNEKLCRLFGVQITARTSVTETLDGVDASSEVTEQCADVRAVGRVTTNKGGECASGGCVVWLRQTYPKSAYLAEKERLEKPTVIQQQVVIQEGDKMYRDPKACETALQSTARVQGRSSAAYLERRKHLREALRTCQGIDGRDSGLFEALNTYLLTPLADYVYEGRSIGLDQDLRLGFVRVEPGFRQSLATKRFLTDRIQAILQVVEASILPMRVFDLGARGRGDPPPSEAIVDPVIAEVVRLPFSTQGTAPSHITSVHRILLDPFWSQSTPSKRYRAFLLEKLADRSVSCDDPTGIEGNAILRYLTLDEELDDAEWAAALAMMQRTPTRDMKNCLAKLLPKKTPEALRARRVAEVATLITTGRIRSKRSSRPDAPADDANVELFRAFISQVPAAERRALYVKHRAELKGTEAAKKSLAESLAQSFQSERTNAWYMQKASESDRAQCETLARDLGAELASLPELPLERTLTCPCLALDSLSAAARADLRRIWLEHSELRCTFFRDDEWPDRNHEYPNPERRWGTEDSPFARSSHVLEDEYKACWYASAISNHELQFTPTTRGTLRGDRIEEPRVSVEVRGELRRMKWKEGTDRWVTKRDVEKERARFAECFTRAVSAYRVPADALRKPLPGPRKIWIQHGDQGTSDGFEP